MLGQDTRSNLVDLAHKLEQRIFWQLAEGEFSLGDVAGIGLAKNGVTISGNHTARIEGGPQVIGDGLVTEIAPDGLLHLGEPEQDFLVGQSVQRPGQSVETCSQRQERRAQSTADQMGGVGADIATFVVTVDGQIQTHQLNKVGILAKAETIGQVEAIILILLDWGNLAILEDVAVDLGGNGRELGNEILRILKGVLPVFLLVDSSSIGFGKLRGLLKGNNGDGELGHGVEVFGQTVDGLLNKLGQFGASSPICRKIADLLLTGDLAGQEQPVQTFREGFFTTRSLGEELLALRDGLSTEANTLFRVEDGTFPDQRLDASSTTIDLVKGDLANDLVAIVFSQLLDLFEFGREVVGEGVFERLEGAC